MSLFFSEQGGESPVVSVWLRGDELSELSHPEQDERLRACYFRWDKEGCGRVRDYLLTMLDEVEGERIFEETMQQVGKGGFDLERRWLVAVSECGGIFSFNAADLDVTQKERDDHRLRWAREQQQLYEQDDGVSFEFNTEDFGSFLEYRYGGDEFEDLREILLNGILRYLTGMVEEMTADRIIEMTQAGCRAGYFGLLNNGETRGWLEPMGFEIGEPLKYLAQVFKDAKGKMNGFHLPQLDFSSLARAVFPVELEDGELGMRTIRLSTIMAELGMVTPSRDYEIGLVGIPSGFNGDRIFVYVKP